MAVQMGMWNFEKPISPAIVGRLSESTAEYGLQEQRIDVHMSLCIAFRPFPTTAEEDGAIQPLLFDNKRNAITWDGRIDNRQELIVALDESLLANAPDASIVAAAYQRWGSRCFCKIKGDWATVIWDSKQRSIFLARDYAGVRPLFYYHTSEGVRWCSHLEALASSCGPFTVCEEYLAGYILLWPEAHLTPYSEIRAVPPGHFIQVSPSKIYSHAYWHFKPEVKTRLSTDTEYEERFWQLFRESVRRRLRANSPVLADLSGGLDSSSIVCMADDLIASGAVLNTVVDTFSALIHDEPGEKDSPYISAVEVQRGRAGHHIELVNGKDAFSTEYKKFVARPGFVRDDFVSAKQELIHRHGYRVLLTGTGGDELLGQALDPRIQIADCLHDFHLKGAADQIGAWSLLLRRPRFHLLVDAALLQLPGSIRASLLLGKRPESWLNPRFAYRHRLAIRQLPAVEGSWAWAPSLRDWFQTYRNLTRQISASRGLREETRYPYLDQDLVEFLVSIPTKQLLRPGDRRSLMRRALARILPATISARRTKSTGGRSIAVTLQRHWPSLQNILNSSLICQLGYVHAKELHTSLLNIKNGNLGPTFLRTMRALSLELWLRAMIERGTIKVENAPISFGVSVANRIAAAE